MQVNEILQIVVNFCRTTLSENTEAQEYLKKRDISKEMLEQFQIGACPKDLSKLYKLVDPAKLREIGFLKDATYCFFNNRIVFPVWNQYGELVAIAGRVLPQYFSGKKKYFNTYYSKGKALFGLNFAIPSILESSEVLVTEGHLDVVTAFQYGIKNIVAVCGTAFTFDHAMLLSRYASKIKLVLDADKAGAKATKKILEKEYVGVTIENVNLPNEEDTDSYLRKYGTEKFLKQVHTNEQNTLRSRLEVAFS